MYPCPIDAIRPAFGQVRTGPRVGDSIIWIGARDRSCSRDPYIAGHDPVSLAEVMVELPHDESGWNDRNSVAAEVVCARQITRSLIGEWIVVQYRESYRIYLAL